MAWSSLKPGGLRTTVLSRLTMHEETIPERIAHAHEPRKLPVVLKRREGRAALASTRTIRDSLCPAVTTSLRRGRISLRHIGSGIVATRSQRGRSRHSASSGHDPERRHQDPRGDRRGTSSPAEQAPKLALLHDHEPGTSRAREEQPQNQWEVRRFTHVA
jgi:hypothetical protein